MGLADRYKGKEYMNSASVQQFGATGAASGGGGQINTQQSSTGLPLSTTLLESTFFKYVLPANSLDRPGRNLLITAYGTFAANNNIKTAKLYWGGTSVSVSGSTTLGTGQSWWAQMNVQSAGTSSGSNQQVINTSVIVSSIHGGVSVSTAAESNTTLPGTTIKITGTSTGASVIGDIVCHNLQIQGLN